MPRYEVAALLKGMQNVDQSFSWEYGFQRPWSYVVIDAENEAAAVEASKVEGKLPERNYQYHQADVFESDEKSGKYMSKIE